MSKAKVIKLALTRKEAIYLKVMLDLEVEEILSGCKNLREVNNKKITQSYKIPSDISSRIVICLENDEE